VVSVSTLAERLEAMLASWSDVHGDPAKDIAGMELYGTAYRECISDLQGVLLDVAPACAHRYLDEPDGSRCIRQAHPHNPNGHQYASGDGSSAGDKHTASEAAAERGRG
jgi:hypothetical protein